MNTFIKYIINKAMGSSRCVPLRPPITENKIRICVSGFTISHHTCRAFMIAKEISAINTEYTTWFYFDNPSSYRKFLKNIKTEFSEEQQKIFANHKSAPFCWLETSEGKIAIGGRDKLCDWVNNSEKFKNNNIKKLTTTEPRIFEAFFSTCKLK